ncbi:hypothetical protein SAMN05444336_102671 [Albimonas donghaensis]|uniref:Uncharacterized protein n=1 Tax=Albimonas donghaensis TaxID=356660 RepID=A0A1H2XAX1_9RHOB|nr:hypothetical protein [Albimonas donghaensis]SDW89957.1 hypothetical protein SAMN05444336_102671 [Albimonas donghaensis]
MAEIENIWISYALNFDGRDADRNMLEAHSAGQSIEGLSWAIALVLNYGITGRTRYSRDLSKSAKIFISPPRRGSVLYDLNILVQQNPFLALVVGGIAVNVVTPYISGLISYLFNQVVGLGDNPSDELGTFLEKLNRNDLNTITQRIEPPLTRAHAAIGRTAETITLRTGAREIFCFDSNTKENLKSRPTGDFDTIDSNITSFNLLTRNGRLFSNEIDATIPFSLRDFTQHDTTTALILSMEQYSIGRNGHIRITGERVETQAGRLVKYIVGSASQIPPADWIDGVDPLRQRRPS